MKNIPNKLSLNKFTVSHLNDEQMNRVNGGDDERCCSYTYPGMTTPINPCCKPEPETSYPNETY